MQRLDPRGEHRPPSPPATAIAIALAFAAACSQAPDRAVGDVLQPAREDGSGVNGREARRASIPGRFQGEWQRDRGACGRAGEGRLLIGPATVRFHQGRGRLQALHAEDGRLDLALQLHGEGRTWEATYRFRLSDDGRRLTDLSSGNGLVRLRCA